MDPVMTEVYSTIVPALPYVIGAYLLMWAILGVALIRAIRIQHQLQKRIDLLERQLNTPSKLRDDVDDSSVRGA